MTRSPDVVVVGGGPAGSVCAALLARAGLQVLLAEASDLSRHKAGEHLGPRVYSFMRRLGLLEGGLPVWAIPLTAVVSYWCEAGPSRRDHLLEDGAPAWSVCRRGLERSLVEKARATGVDVRLGCRLRRWRRTNGIWFLDLGPAGTVSCFYLVDARGRTSQGFGIPGRCRAYLDRTLAIQGVALSAGPADPELVVEALANGWIYSVPAPTGDIVVTLVTDADLERLPGPGFADALARAPISRGRIRSIPVGFRTVDARLSCLSLERMESWLPIGDALATTDPLSGLGLEWALDSAKAAAEALCDHLVHGQGAAPLQAYLDASYRRFLDELGLRASLYRQAPWSGRFWQRRRHMPNPWGEP